MKQTVLGGKYVDVPTELGTDDEPLCLSPIFIKRNHRTRGILGPTREDELSSRDHSITKCRILKRKI